jgi:glycosyltransferase involved in cell wall biosynthesis
MGHIGIIATDSWYVLNFRTTTILRLIDEGYDITVFCGNKQFMDELRSLGANAVYIPVIGRSINPVIVLRDFLILLFAVRKYRPSVILSFNPKTNVFTGLLRLFTKFRWVANISGTGVLGKKRGLLGYAIVQMYKFSFKKVDYVIFQNSKDKINWIESKIVSKECALRQFGSGVDLKKFQITEPKDDKITVVCISRLLVEKGIEYFINLAKITTEKSANISFILAGNEVDINRGGYNIDRVIEAQNAGYIEYIGMQRDVVPLISKRTIGCLLTRYNEGLPKSILEFMAVGRPVLISDFSAAEELVPLDKNGLIVNLDDSQWMEQASRFILELANDPEEYKRMCVNSRELAVNVFNDEIGISEYISLITRLTTFP